MIGGLYQDTRRDFLQYVVNGGAENSAVSDPSYRYAGFVKDSYTDGKTLAAYGQAILTVTDAIEATGGIRYTHETKDSEFVQPYAANALFAPGVVVAADQTFDNWSPEATLRWQPARDGEVLVVGAGSFVRMKLAMRVRFGEPLPSVDELRLVEN